MDAFDAGVRDGIEKTASMTGFKAKLKTMSLRDIKKMEKRIARRQRTYKKGLPITEATIPEHQRRNKLIAGVSQAVGEERLKRDPLFRAENWLVSKLKGWG